MYLSFRKGMLLSFRTYIAIITITFLIGLICFFQITTQYGMFRRYFSKSEGTCDNVYLNHWWNSNITASIHDTSSESYHSIEIDILSQMPVRSGNKSVSGFNNKPTQRYVFINASGCLHVDKMKKGLAQVMNDRNFEGATCVSKNASFDTSIVHRTALASYPGSGNTWTRHLLEYVSGTLTGSVYNDSILKKTLKGESKWDDVLVIKTHRSPINFDNAVVLIRHPADCILSFYNFQRAHSHTDVVTANVFSNSDWNEFVQAKCGVWKRFHYKWLQDFKGRKMVLSYKNLQQDFFNELFRVSRFLNVSVTYKTLWCAYKNQEGSFHRTSSNNINTLTLYDEPLLAKIESARKDVNQLIKVLFGIDDMI